MKFYAVPIELLYCLIGHAPSRGFELTPFQDVRYQQHVTRLAMFAGRSPFSNKPNPSGLHRFYARSSEEEEEIPSLKRNEDDEVYFELSSKRRLTICNWQGNERIDIREFYEKDGKQLPGKKGISLSLKEYQIIKQFIVDGTLDDIIDDLKDDE